MLAKILFLTSVLVIVVAVIANAMLPKFVAVAVPGKAPVRFTELW